MPENVMLAAYHFPTKTYYKLFLGGKTIHNMDIFALNANIYRGISMKHIVFEVTDWLLALQTSQIN